MFPTAQNPETVSSETHSVSLCLSVFLSPLNYHHLVLRPLSNCPRPLIVLINVVHFTWLRSFPIPLLFFQSHSFVNLWQTDKEELVGEVLHLWPVDAISYEGPWERDTHQNSLWPESSMWSQTQRRQQYSKLQYNVRLLKSLFPFRQGLKLMADDLKHRLILIKVTKVFQSRWVIVLCLLLMD